MEALLGFRIGLWDCPTSASLATIVATGIGGALFIPGLPGRIAIGSQIDRQPIPRSTRRAQQGAQAKFAATMAPATRHDEKGNRAERLGALEAAKKMYILQGGDDGGSV